MSVFQVSALLIVLAGLFGAVNYFVLRLPQSIGILVVALMAALGVMALDWLLVSIAVTGALAEAIRDLHFSENLLHGMLGLLLFAGALHVRIGDLKAQALPVLLMATIGVALSTIIAGVGFSWITGMPLLMAMVFGALISPTDPVAVLGVLKNAGLQKSLETKIAGESLFNDGVGYVVFLFLVGLAFPGGAHHASGWEAALTLFVQEAGGGALLGGILGWLTFQLMRRIDDYPLEVLLSLGLAFGGYELAVALHMSGPITAVVAGLFIGDVGVKYGMSEQTRAYVEAFWKLIDEILNAILFLFIGIEVLAVAFTANALIAGLLAIALSLFARFVAVAVPVLMLHPFRGFSRGIIPIMTWGGLKGGISVALALSLPESEWKPLILTATYVVVVFSIIVQGLTIAPLARRVGREPDLM
ncbi:MAG: sodium:proton antiporter [Rhodobacteraceae bacterium]|nr:sodium:proton antiporter [Paracoccaceae bacterium]